MGSDENVPRCAPSTRPVKALDRNSLLDALRALLPPGHPLAE